MVSTRCCFGWTVRTAQEAVHLIHPPLADPVATEEVTFSCFFSNSTDNSSNDSAAAAAPELQQQVLKAPPGGAEQQQQHLKLLRVCPFPAAFAADAAPKNATVVANSKRMPLQQLSQLQLMAVRVAVVAAATAVVALPSALVCFSEWASSAELSALSFGDRLDSGEGGPSEWSVVHLGADGLYEVGQAYLLFLCAFPFFSLPGFFPFDANLIPLQLHVHLPSSF